MTALRSLADWWRLHPQNRHAHRVLCRLLGHRWVWIDPCGCSEQYGFMRCDRCLTEDHE